MMSAARKTGLDFSWRSKVPVIFQTEVAECGLACIAMVACFLGHSIDVSALRRKFSASLKGLNLKHLMQVADQCGLAARPVRCEVDEIGQLRLPAILHWNLNHFVVVTKVVRRGIWVHDPAVGKRLVTHQECSENFTGVAMELQRGADFTVVDDTSRLRLSQLWTRVLHLKRTLATLLGLSLLIQVAGIAAPYYMQWVVDHVLVTADRDLLLILALGFGLLMLTSALLSTMRTWLVLRLSSVMNLQMGVNLLQHLLRLPMDYFEKRHVGDVVSRFASLGQVRERLTTGIVETLVDGVMSILVLAVMLLYSIKLTLVVLAAVSLYLIIRAISYGPLYRASENAIRAGADEQTNFLENIRGIQTIKLFGSESDRLGLWQNRFTEVINNEIALGKLNISFSLISGLIFGVENILVVYLAAGLVLSGSMSIGMVLAFIAYKNQLTGRLSSLVEQWIAFRMLRLHLNRLADIALTEPEDQSCELAYVKQNKKSPADSSAHGSDLSVTDSNSSVSNNCDLNNSDSNSSDSAVPGAFKVQNLHFRYGDNEAPVLNNINFSIAPGEVVAIVGPSGGGKTTLLKLLLGLIRPSSGNIFFDGQDLNQLGPKAYRRQLAAVMQNDSLLSGSVSDNICFFDLEPNILRIQHCATLAAIDDDIRRLPMGYHSLVGDMGSQFSGGQIQRLMLARALYQQPRVLLLDEATSHLDIHNERRISEQINSLEMTRIIVAHRPETIRHADKILRLVEGQLECLVPTAESGTSEHVT